MEQTSEQGMKKCHICPSRFHWSASSIANIQDLDKFMKKVCDLDPETNAYRKPSSSQTFAGITNIEIWVYERDREIPTGVIMSSVIILIFGNLW